MAIFPIALYRSVLAMECIASITMNHIVQYFRHPRLVAFMVCFHVQNLVIQMIYLLFFATCHEMMLEWVEADFPISLPETDLYFQTCNIPWHDRINAYCIFVFGPFLNLYNLRTAYHGRRRVLEENAMVVLLMLSQWHIVVMLGLPNFLSNLVVTLHDGMHAVPTDLHRKVA